MPTPQQSDVAAWLTQLGLASYTNAFRDNDVDATVLRSLTADDLRELGVVSIGHRRRLLDAIANLKDAPATELVEEAAPVEQPRSAERRMLTVMFCDLVDSVALSVEVDPEDYRELIASFRYALEAVIRDFGGNGGAIRWRRSDGAFRLPAFLR